MSSSRMRDDDSNVYQLRKESIQSGNQAYVKESGNSDVDVYVAVEVDTKPIAYAMLCSLLATKQITEEEFEKAINRFEQLTEKDSKKKQWKKGSRWGKQNHGNNPFEFPKSW